MKALFLISIALLFFLAFSTDNTAPQEEAIQYEHFLRLKHIDNSQNQMIKYKDCTQNSKTLQQDYDKCQANTLCTQYQKEFKQCLHNECTYRDFQSFTICIDTCKKLKRPVNQIFEQVIGQIKICAEFAFQDKLDHLSQSILPINLLEHKDSGIQFQKYQQCIQGKPELQQKYQLCKEQPSCLTTQKNFKQCLFDCHYQSFKQLSACILTCKEQIKFYNDLFNDILSEVYDCSNLASQYAYISMSDKSQGKHIKRGN